MLSATIALVLLRDRQRQTQMETKCLIKSIFDLFSVVVRCGVVARGVAWLWRWRSRWRWLGATWYGVAWRRMVWRGVVWRGGPNRGRPWAEWLGDRNLLEGRSSSSEEGVPTCEGPFHHLAFSSWVLKSNDQKQQLYHLFLLSHKTSKK